MGGKIRHTKDMQKWQEMGRIGKVPVRPVPPEYLRLWFELKRWPGSLLVEGGLLDQPAWTWELIDLAGLIYESVMAENERTKSVMEETGEQ